MRFVISFILFTAFSALQAQEYQTIQMKKFGGPEVLQMVTHKTLPEPGPGKVRIKIEAASASFTDVMVRKGIYYGIDATLPYAPGYDLVGFIDKVGSGVTKWKVGQRVADLSRWGGYSQYAIRPVKHLVAVPTTVDAGEAVSLVLVWTTAYQLLHRQAQVKKGQSILIHGVSGGVGSALARLAKLHGLKVYGTASGRKHEYVRSLGVTPIDYRKEDFVKRTKELTGGVGVDVVFDFISLENFNRSFEALAPKGKLVIYGFYNKANKSKIGGGMAGVFLRMKLKMISWNWLPRNGRSAGFYSIKAMRDSHPEHFSQDLSILFTLLKDKKIKPNIFKRMPLGQAAEAHRLIEARKVKGKIILEPFSTKKK